jgi:hypothetical protein
MLHDEAKWNGCGRKRNFAAVYGRREDSPDLVHGLNPARFSPNSHHLLGAPGEPMLLPMRDFGPMRQSPNHSGDRSVSGSGKRGSGLHQQRPPSPPPLPPGDDGRPTHFLFDFGLFDPDQDRCTSSRPHRLIFSSWDARPALYPRVARLPCDRGWRSTMSLRFLGAKGRQARMATA